MRYIKIENHHIGVIELDKDTYDPFVQKILRIAGLEAIALEYCEFMCHLNKPGSVRLQKWIAKVANMSLDQARLHLKRFVLIWGACGIVRCETLQSQLEILEGMTGALSTVISLKEKEISITDIREMFIKEGIEEVIAGDANSEMKVRSSTSNH